jgi:uncharacterized protein DUF2721
MADDEDVTHAGVAMTLHDLIPILQIAVGPVILISGVGLLLLSMTNRFGRVIDRSRELALELRSADDADRRLLHAQLDILSTRATRLRQASALAIVSLLFAAVLVIVLFVAAIQRWEGGTAAALIFICCMAALIAALVAFLLDINLSLVALKLEVKAAGDRGAPGAQEG